MTTVAFVCGGEATSGSYSWRHNPTSAVAYLQKTFAVTTSYEWVGRQYVYFTRVSSVATPEVWSEAVMT